MNRRDSIEPFCEIRSALHDFDLNLARDARGYMGRQCTVDSISYTVMLGRDGRNAPIRVRHSEDDIPHLLDEINSLWVPSTAAPQPRR